MKTWIQNNDMKEGTREDRIIARRHRRTLRGNTAGLMRRIYEDTGGGHMKELEHMVTQEDLKEDTEEHLGMHRRI